MANYVKGKWYKCNEWSSREDFCKASSMEGYGIYYDEKIHRGVYEKVTGNWGEGNGLIEASPEEYSKFLPDKHPDKIAEPAMVGRWFECMQDGANGCVVNGKSVKKGDYVQIEFFGKGSFKEFYQLKNGNYLGKLDEDAAFLRGEIVRGFKLMPIGFSPTTTTQSTTQSTGTDSFVGRYLKALEDKANGAPVTQGEYYRIQEDSGSKVWIFATSGQFTYGSKGKAEEALRARGVELMPVGFVPPSKTAPATTSVDQKPDDFEMISGNWYVIDNLQCYTSSGTYDGKIGHVFQYDGKMSSGYMYYASSLTTCEGACWEKKNLRPATPSEIETAERKYFPEKFLVPEPPKTEDTMMTLDSYDGYKVGSILYETDLTKWTNTGSNYYSATSKGFKKTSTSFAGNRFVEKIAMIEDKVCFLVSGTANVWILAEGYRKFIDSVESKPEDKPILSSYPVSIANTGARSYNIFSVGDKLDKDIVNKFTKIEGNQFWNESGNPRWTTAGGLWAENPKIHEIASVCGYICYRLGVNTSSRNFYIKADAFVSFYKEHTTIPPEHIFEKPSDYMDWYSRISPPEKPTSSSYRDVDDDGLEFQSPVIVKKSAKKPKLVIL